MYYVYKYHCITMHTLFMVQLKKKFRRCQAIKILPVYIIKDGEILYLEDDICFISNTLISD